jgi:BolA protein
VEANLSERKSRIEQRLRESLSPVELSIEDESHLHAGHAGARDGRGHFRVAIVSERFEGVSRVKRHRMVYDALELELRDDIHALAIEAFTPREWGVRPGAGS